MDLRRLITRSFIHYLKGNILAAGGLAIATALITGALIIGDSLSHSLGRAVTLRLGTITHSVTAGERLFTMELADRFAGESGLPVSGVMVAEGMAVAGDGMQLNRIQVLGVDSNFSKLLNTGFDHSSTAAGEVVISENMAVRLQLEVGDFFLLRMKRAGVIPMNTPLVSDADQSVSRRVRVAAIAGDDDFGRFNLRVSQTVPYNVFANAGWLNALMGLDGMANALLISGPGADPDTLKQYLDRSWKLADANMDLREIEGREVLEISSGRVFIEEHVSATLENIFPGSRQFLTYFVNSLDKDGKSTPYSFVTAGHRFSLKKGEVVISRWLADDLAARPGDTIQMRYWETGARRELTEREISLVIRDIAPMEEIVQDTVLMPHLPGLSDAGNCRDWDAGVPISLERIRDKDEKYWDEYRGTPKAYISLEQGRQLWTNRFGNLTSLWLPENITSLMEAEELVTSSLDPAGIGFIVNELLEQGMQSAANGVDFGILFGGLGFFVMLAGIMLFFLLLLFSMEKRGDQIRLFSSLGFRKSLIRKVYLGEWMLVAVAGSAAGLLVAVAYGKLVHWALSELWQDIVRTDMLGMVIKPSSLIAGFLIGLAVAALVIIISLNRFILKAPDKRDQQQFHVPEKGAGVPSRTLTSFQKARNRSITAIALLLAGGLILTIQLTSGGGDIDPVSFFAAGGLLIPSFLLFADAFLLRMEGKNYVRISMARLSMKNLVRNRIRSLSVIVLLSLGIFVVIATGSHRKDAASGETGPDGGTGGFLLVAEATVPVLYDLNGRDTQINLNIPSGTSFVQFMSSFADDASCLNLNEVANPRILSVNPALLEGRFSFARESEWLDPLNPWESLDTEVVKAGPTDLSSAVASHTIPAIADQAVIQWGLGKKVGDTLFYTNERGEELNLLLIGGLANSVFQGNVLISEKNFLKHFPSTSGSSFFLIRADSEREEEVREELDFIFRDHGWDSATTVYRLNEFNSVENTYLGIFLMLGALGLLVGVVGLAVVMARSIIERRNEIALYVSLGYRRSQITAIIFWEYLILLLAGLAAGVPPAIIAGLPSLIPGSQSVNISFLVILTTAILINGALWIIFTARAMTTNLNISALLRND